MRHHAPVLAVVLLAWSGVGGGAQGRTPPGQLPPQPPDAQQARPMQPLEPAATPSAVEVIIDVSVLDGAGRPVAELQAQDLSVVVDGAPRKIVSLEFISHLAPAVPAGAAAPVPAAEPRYRRAFSSNTEGPTPPPGRTILFVVDHEHIQAGHGRGELNSIGQFLDRLPPADRVGLAVIPRGGGNVGFSTDREPIRQALSKVIGRPQAQGFTHAVGLADAFALAANDAQTWRAAVNRECGLLTPTTNSAAAQSQYADCVRGMENSAYGLVQETDRTTRDSLSALRALLVALDRLPGPKTVVLLAQSLPVSNYLLHRRDFQADVTDLGILASRARVNIHVLQMNTAITDGTSGADAEIRSLGLEGIAGATGGERFLLGGTADRALDRIALETSGRYLLGFESLENDRDGRAHGIQVRVARPGVTVRARSHFRYDRRTAVTHEPDEIVADLLRSATPARELPIQVTTYALQAPEGKGKIRLLVSANIDRGVAKPAKVTVGFLLFDAEGKTIGNSFDQGELAPAAAAGGALAYTGAAIVQPGQYTLRLGVVDASGRRGSVEHQVDARLTNARQVQLGNLIVMDMDDPADARALRPSVEGTARGALAGYLEVYSTDADQLKKVSAALEIAGAEEADPLASAPMELDSKLPGRLTASARLPLGMVPPGEYLARATVSLAGSPLGHVWRPVRIEASPAGAARATSAPFVTARSMVGPFQMRHVLQPAVVGHFLDRLNELSSQSATGATGKAAAEARGGRFDAIPDLLGKRSDDDLAAAFLRGLALYAKGELEKAATEFRAALRISSEFLPAAFYLGACYAAGGREDEAAGAWHTSLVSETSSPIVYRLLGENLLRRGEADEAQEILVESLALWPEDEDLKHHLALAYAMTGRAPEALEALDARIAKHPEDHEAILLALSCLFDAHAAGQAATSLDKARAARYAALYAKSGGDKQALVALWAQAVAR
jgi:VWFA-related protein